MAFKVTPMIDNGASW